MHAPADEAPNMPRPHVSQLEDPLWDAHPFGQAAHVELPPSDSWKYPGSHSTQADMPVVFATVPRLHSVHRDAPLESEVHPFGQAAHVDLPPGDSWKYPGSHSTQADMPVVFATVPRLYRAHLADSLKSTY